MKEDLLSTKLHQPRLFPGTISRPRLIQMLKMGLSSRLILLSAPAGFGKTNLLADWLSNEPGSVAWISMDKGDNDEVRFLRYLIAGIHSVVSGFSEKIDRILNDSQTGMLDTDPLMIILMNELAVLSEQIIILLDDYHVIENASIHHIITFFIDHMPSNVHIILSTRSDPPLPTARWRALGHMVEIRSHDLRFTPDEVRQYLDKGMGQSLDVNDIAALATKTEGWAVGLQMAIISMRGRADIPKLVQDFSGSHRYIMDYLVEEVLNRQSEDIHAFLLQTSILGQMTGQLCDALTGQTGSQQILDMLENSNMFLIPLDDQRRWFRYHHLFADLLHVRLLNSQPGLVKTLHHRASVWFEANGRYSDAISHSLAACDYERSANLLDQISLQMISQGELSSLIEWQAQVPIEIVLIRPRLCVYLSWAFVFAGRISDAEALLQEFENSIDPNILSDNAGDIMGNILAQRAIIADMRGDTSIAVDLAGKADKLLSSQNILFRSVVPFILARAYRLAGDSSKAISKLNEVAEMAMSMRNVMTLSAARYDLACIWIVEGKLRQAADTLQDTLQFAASLNAQDFGTIAKIYSGSSDLLREWNDLEPAKLQVEDAIDRMAFWKNPTDLLIALISLLKIQQACGNLSGAEDTIVKAESIKRSCPLFPPLGTLVEIGRVKLWLAQGNLPAAIRWMETRRVSHVGTLIEQELIQVAIASVLIRQGEYRHALALLTESADVAEKGGRFGKLIEILVLQALCFKALNDEGHALSALMKALTLAEPEGYIRIFVDEGRPMAEMIYALRQRRLYGKSRQNIDKDYLVKLLAAFPEAISVDQQEPRHNLSEREAEILCLMAQGMTNSQIAAELFITTGTVKAHTASIYRKFDVSSRSQAIAIAHEMKILKL